ncbi:MAG: PD-(D/E)XK nuclease family protein [Elainellaceae cyanobacterium]
MPLRLSQAHLAILTLCPRKFQYRYLDQIGGIVPQTQQQLWGSQFHQLMQQQGLGLPLSAPDPELGHCMTALQAAAPYLFGSAPNQQSEHRLGLTLGNHALVAVYDRLVLEGDRATIYDWKTHSRPLSRQQLAQSWQTRLYLYILAAVGTYSPESLSMVYWFVRLTPEHPVPQSVVLPYSVVQHRQTRADLTAHLQQLDRWLARYEHRPLPQLPPGSPHCADCAFAVRCDRLPRQRQNQRQTQRLLSVEDISEVPI